MEVKSRYKQTDVGSIPEEWCVLPFDDVLQRKNAKAHQIPASEYQATGSIPVVDQGQETIVGYSENIGRRFTSPQDGVIVFGDHTCIVKFVDFDFLVGADGTQILIAKNNNLARFQAYELEHRGVTSTGYNRHFKFLRDRCFISPPLPEQRVVAAALSDMDALLNGLARLIAKKHDLKEAAMQQLLTGQTRLPGFHEAWKARRLGEIGSTYGGLTGKSKADFGAGGGRYVTFLNVMTNVVIDCRLFEQVRVSPSESQNRVIKGDLLFNGSSETPEEVAMCSFMAEDVPDLYLNSFCFGFRLQNEQGTDGLFLAYYIRAAPGRELMKSLAQGSTRYNLSKGALLEAIARLPHKDEQTAIASVLSDMDAELAALKARRDKTCELKQAMMQELLTGRIRLVPMETADA